MNRLQEAIHKEARLPLMGAFVSRYDPMFLEICGHVGVHAVWFDMEHGFVTFSEAAELCRLALGMEMLSVIRIPDARRENVLKAAECGPDIIVLPMANSAEVVQELISHARYAPEGNRGYYSISRAQKYGLGGAVAAERQRTNRQLALMAQIETQEAVEHVEEICGVPGLDLVFIGLGDLSASLGVVGQPNHPTVVAATEKVIATAKSQGKLVAVPGRAADMGVWAGKGVDLVFCATDVVCLRSAVESIVEEARTALG